MGRCYFVEEEAKWPTVTLFHQLASGSSRERAGWARAGDIEGADLARLVMENRGLGNRERTVPRRSNERRKRRARSADIERVARYGIWSVLGMSTF